ncbi:hydantoinase/oxoprolinase family protein [Paenarthrobacter sp. NPDC058040]|uniref:hydantoinase/oxoprolinase family protein n=1 Tax=unclassified Paenarthrobacter TaxID=2634190 RepID=UPI0036DD2117
MTYVAGIDVGGTFTDVLLYEEDKRKLRLAKVFSTPAMQADGLLNGLNQFGVPLSELDALLHGTTVATNAVLERKGARTALVTTRGFQDVLELRRRDRPTTYGLTGQYTPLVPRSRSYELDERIGSDGEVVTPLTEEALRDLVTALRHDGIESVAVCLINSYANSAHEAKVADFLQRELPEVAVSVSYEISPQLGEYERASTTAINAFVTKQMSLYLGTVQDRMLAQGFNHDVLVMQSNGGVIPAKQAGKYAVRTLLSGPAAGTVAAAHFGKAAGLPDVISCDMGGTSFDVALIPAAAPAVTSESEIEYGLPLKLPMIDIKTIGAGGGSIASIDRAGILQVGPESAGSFPGPACYGRGGARPTISDANMVLGRIAATQTLGTQDGFQLDYDAAWIAIENDVAIPLGLSVPDAALAIVRIANEMMANAIRMVSVDKGHDPRKFSLVGFGGAGPLHIAELARSIGANSVIIPPHPGALSAFGCLMGDIKYDFMTAVTSDVRKCSPGDVQATLAGHREEGEGKLHSEGFGTTDIEVEHIAVLSYAKQMYTIDVPLGAQESDWTPEALTDAFLAKYAETFGSRQRSGAINLVSLRTVVTGLRKDVDFEAPQPVPGGEGSRTVIFDDGEHEVPVLRRESFVEGQVIEGPAVINQTDTTTILPPRSVAVVQANGSLVVEVSA